MRCKGEYGVAGLQRASEVIKDIAKGIKEKSGGNESILLRSILPLDDKPDSNMELDLAQPREQLKMHRVFVPFQAATGRGCYGC